MKKKILVAILALAFIGGIGYGADFSLELKTNWLSPAETAFKDVYGGGMAVGGALAVGITPHWELSLEMNRISRDGELTYTKEPTEMSVFSIGVDVKFLFPLKKITLYAGAGIYSHSFKEDNRLGHLKKSGVGFKLKTGALVPLFDRFRLNLFAGYSFCRMTPGQFEIAIGGFEAGAGVRYTFK